MDKRDPGAEHRRTQDLLGPYVLGALEPNEQREVERHLGACAACREEERGLRETHERLAGAAIAGAAAPPRLKERILAALPPRNAAETPPAEEHGRPRRTVLAAVAAAAALLVVALAAVAYSAWPFDSAETASLAPTELAPGAGGEIEVESSGAGTEAELEVWGLPRTGPNEYYQLWFGREEGRISAGTFVVDDEGRGRLYTTCPKVAAGGYRRVGITLERFPEEPRRDSARVVLGGELRGS